MRDLQCQEGRPFLAEGVGSTRVESDLETAGICSPPTPPTDYTERELALLNSAHRDTGAATTPLQPRAPRTTKPSREEAGGGQGVRVWGGSY